MELGLQQPPTIEQRMRSVLSNPQVVYANSWEATDALLAFRKGLLDSERIAFDDVVSNIYLNDSNLNWRQAAYELIPEIPLPGCIPTLTKRLQTAEDEEKPHVVFCLGRFRDQSLFQTLEEYTKSPDAYLSYAAIQGMIRSDPERAAPYIVKAFVHEIPIRTRSLKALLSNLVFCVGPSKFYDFARDIYSTIRTSHPRRFCKRFKKALTNLVQQYNQNNQNDPLSIQAIIAEDQ